MTDPQLLLYSIAINAYDRGNALRGCVPDSNHLVAALEPLGFECHQLLDRRADLATMEAFIGEAVSRVGPRDLLVLHYSGHGGQLPSTTEPDRLDECWFAWDLAPLVDNRIGELLGRVHRQGRLQVISDSCHAQSVTRAIPLGVAGAGDGYRKARLYVPPEVELGRRRPKRGPDRALVRAARAGSPIVEFAACRDSQVTYDAQIGGPDSIQGCYTWAVLEAVKELTAEAGWRFTMNDWQRAIRRRLPSEDYDNEPQILATAGRRRWLALTADRRR